MAQHGRGRGVLGRGTEETTIDRDFRGSILRPRRSWRSDKRGPDHLHGEPVAEAEAMTRLIARRITIVLEPRDDRDDGGLRVWSDDIPGLILSHSDQRLVLLDIGPAIIALAEHEKGK